MLVVEDNPGDAVLFQAFFQQRERKTEFFLVDDGEQALDFLHHQGAHPHSPRPDLIVMDVNIPKIDGKDLVKEIKLDPSLRSIPIIVLTSSENEEDVRACYENGANCVLIKAGDVDEASRVFELIESFWVNTVRLVPAKEEHSPLENSQVSLAT